MSIISMKQVFSFHYKVLNSISLFCRVTWSSCRGDAGGTQRENKDNDENDKSNMEKWDAAYTHCELGVTKSAHLARDIQIQDLYRFGTSNWAWVRFSIWRVYIMLPFYYLFPPLPLDEGAYVGMRKWDQSFHQIRSMTMWLRWVSSMVIQVSLIMQQNSLSFFVIACPSYEL